MKFAQWIIIGILIAILGWAGYSLVRQKNEVRADIETLSAATKKLEVENASLEASIKYLSRPENLVKESKAHFNYKNAGEQMIILVPGKTSTTPTSTKQ